MRVLGIDNIVLDVADMNVARAFYGDRLGLVEKYYFADAGVLGYRVGDEEPGLVLRHDPAVSSAEHRGPRVWLEVEDARQVLAELTSAGVEILAGPTELRTGCVVELADPFGNVIGLVDYSAALGLARPVRADPLSE